VNKRKQPSRRPPGVHKIVKEHVGLTKGWPVHNEREDVKIHLAHDVLERIKRYKGSGL